MGYMFKRFSLGSSNHLSNLKYLSKILVLSISCLVVAFSFSGTALAQQATDVSADKEVTMKAQVEEIASSTIQTLPGTDTKESVQTLKVKILDGAEVGKEVTVDNDYINLKQGETFYLKHTSDSLDGTDFYTVEEPYRLPQLIILVLLFLAVVFIFGGIQGVRGLVSLIGSLLLIIYVLLPGILHGISPILVTVGVSSLIIIVGSYITHGFNRTTTSAILGMILTVSVTGLLAYWSVHFTRLSGMGSEEVAYLNINARGSIDVIGLLLGGIMIGLLGVLYDIAIGQAISVEELLHIAPDVSKKHVYDRAIRIGREHIGALINTLAIAYVGVALPLLLLFSQASTDSVWVILNREVFATEIVRTMIGSIGLVLAVPITTFVSVWLLTRKGIKRDERSSGHGGHTHSHSHSHNHN
jgi:uncharacterized membrane protein